MFYLAKKSDFTRFWVKFGMIFIENKTKLDIDTSLLDNIASYMSNRDIELILCDDTYIAKLNREYRSKENATDVLSFPLEGDMPHMPLGTIVISLDRAVFKADELGHSVDDEVALLFIHGLLHLLGCDHESDSGQMREKEHKLIKKFSLPSSLIVRSEDS